MLNHLSRETSFFKEILHKNKLPGRCLVWVWLSCSLGFGGVFLCCLVWCVQKEVRIGQEWHKHPRNAENTIFLSRLILLCYKSLECHCQVLNTNPFVPPRNLADEEYCHTCLVILHPATEEASTLSQTKSSQEKKQTPLNKSHRQTPPPPAKDKTSQKLEKKQNLTSAICTRPCWIFVAELG